MSCIISTQGLRGCIVAATSSCCTAAAAQREEGSPNLCNLHRLFKGALVCQQFCVSPTTDLIAFDACICYPVTVPTSADRQPPLLRTDCYSLLRFPRPGRKDSDLLCIVPDNFHPSQIFPVAPRPSHGLPVQPIALILYEVEQRKGPWRLHLSLDAFLRLL
jgi:hypothetical protein